MRLSGRTGDRDVLLRRSVLPQDPDPSKMYMSDPLRTTDNADDRVHGRPSIFNTGATVLLSVALAVTSSLVAVELKYASPSALTVSQCVPGVPCIARRSADDGSCPAADSDTLAMLLQAPPVEKGTSTLSSCSSICPESGEYTTTICSTTTRNRKRNKSLSLNAACTPRAKT